MGIGGGIFLIAFGAILAFGVNTTVWWLDLDVVGFVLMFAGVAVLCLTIWFWRGRHRNRKGLRRPILNETLISHGSPISEVPPAPPPPPAGHQMPPP